MSDRDFYFFRTELRKKLGRILFYPQNIDEFIANSTKNEKEMLIKIINYLKETHENTSIVKNLKGTIKQYGKILRG